MAHFEYAGVVGYAYVAVQRGKVLDFHCGCLPAEADTGKHPETVVQEMARETYPQAVLHSDHVSGPHAVNKVPRDHPMVMLCHHAAREQAMSKILNETRQERHALYHRLEQLRKPHAKSKARQFLAART